MKKIKKKLEWEKISVNIQIHKESLQLNQEATKF